MGILSGIDGTGPLAKLIYRRAGRSRRISSWDKTGGNRDFLTILQGEIATLAKIEGAGCIRHIWFTVACNHEGRYAVAQHIIAGSSVRFWSVG